jgi:hypothetical protein
MTDGGPCCFISPYINFVNPKTRDKDPHTLTGEEWHLRTKGSKSGLMGGLKLVLDIESFDFVYSGKISVGFRLGFLDQRDKAVIKQDGYYISTGISKFYGAIFCHSIW